jgi:hypothetical protein
MASQLTPLGRMRLRERDDDDEQQFNVLVPLSEDEGRKNLAARILLAGAKRRGEVQEAPPDGLARAIILASKRRRGERLSTEDENWLNEFVTKYGQRR